VSLTLEEHVALSQRDLLAALQERRLIVCVGSGGVGKTTTAAALAIQAAILGRRAIVVTIDPARRLANSLGLKALGNDELPISLEKFRAAGVEPKGTLHAMMLDTKQTFNDVIARVSPDDETRDRVLGNLIYRHISDTLSASHDYMASEKLYDLYSSGRYDLIVLDTPPMKNAIDFLESGGRLARFFDEGIISWFMKPHKKGRRRGLGLISGTGTVVYKLLGYVFGTDFLDEIAEFFIASKDLFEGFRERANTVSELLRDSDRTRFVVICTAASTSMEEARYFHRQLMDRDMPGGHFIVNQIGRYAELERAGDTTGLYLGQAERAWLKETLDGAAGKKKVASFVERLEGHFGRAVAAARDDRRAIEGLRAFAGSKARVCLVPRMAEDIYDFDGLLRIDRALFGDALDEVADVS
jgi:anion-transporting  ArsA/GET3 family ATPase